MRIASQRWRCHTYSLPLLLACLLGSAASPAAQAKSPRPDFPAASIHLPAAPAETSVRNVAIAGDTLVVATVLLAEPSVPVTVWVYRRTGAGWAREAVLTPQGSPLPASQFGLSVALSDHVIVVGAPDGGAYVFNRARGVWRQQAVLTGEAAGITSAFGRSVAISESRILVGGPSVTTRETDGGAAFAFQHSGGAWRPDGTFTDENAAYGTLTAISGDLAVAGYSGRLDVFARGAAGWTREAQLEVPGSGGFFTAVALSGSTLALGASDGVEIWVGDDDGTWTKQATLPVQALDLRYLSLDGDSLAVVTAEGVQVFSRQAGAWTAKAALELPPGVPARDFGRAVALSGDTAIVASDGPLWVFDPVVP